MSSPEIPAIAAVLIDRPEEDALGAGKPAIWPVVAAVGNAIPFTPARVLAALGSARG